MQRSTFKKSITQKLDKFTPESLNDKELIKDVEAFLADNATALQSITDSLSVPGNGMWMWRDFQESERFLLLGHLLRCAVFDAAARGDCERASNFSRALLVLGKDALRGEILQVTTAVQLFRLGCQNMAWTIAFDKLDPEKADTLDAAIKSCKLK
jgi:hypothetical protein